MDMEAYKTLDTTKTIKTYINKLSPKERLNLLKTNPVKYIQRIKHPTKEEQETAINLNERCLRHIDNSNTEILLYAIQNNPYAIEYMSNPCLEVQLTAVQRNGCCVNCIANPCLEVQLAAVQQNGIAIVYIKDPSVEVQLAAVQQNGIAIVHIKDPSVEVQLAAIENNYKSIKFIKNKNEELTAACITGIEAKYAAGNFSNYDIDDTENIINHYINYTCLSKETKMRILYICITLNLISSIDNIFTKKYISYYDLDDPTKILLELL